MNISQNAKLRFELDFGKTPELSVNGKEFSPVFNFTLQSRRIVYRDGLRCWETLEERVQYPASQTALIIVDLGEIGRAHV
jgi:glutathione peroxidase-family protein